MAQVLAPAGPQPHSRSDLLGILVGWHQALSTEHPSPFPGPLAGRDMLSLWVHDVRTRSEARGIPRQQWANALLSWIPAAPAGKTGFREHLLKCMRSQKALGEWEEGRFWRWEQFKPLFFKMCENEVMNNRLLIGAAAVGSAVALPVIGLPLLGALGFTASGIAGGSLAASLQSVAYGGATGGAFSVLQSIGARAAFPIAYNFVAGAVGAGVTATTTQYKADDADHDADLVGDIGDDPRLP